MTENLLFRKQEKAHSPKLEEFLNLVARYETLEDTSLIPQIYALLKENFYIWLRENNATQATQNGLLWINRPLVAGESHVFAKQHVDFIKSQLKAWFESALVGTPLYIKNSLSGLLGYSELTDTRLPQSLGGFIESFSFCILFDDDGVDLVPRSILLDKTNEFIETLQIDTNDLSTVVKTAERLSALLDVAMPQTKLPTHVSKGFFDVKEVRAEFSLNLFSYRICEWFVLNLEKSYPIFNAMFSSDVRKLVFWSTLFGFFEGDEPENRKRRMLVEHLYGYMLKDDPLLSNVLQDYDQSAFPSSSSQFLRKVKELPQRIEQYHKLDPSQPQNTGFGLRNQIERRLANVSKQQGLSTWNSLTAQADQEEALERARYSTQKQQLTSSIVQMSQFAFEVDTREPEDQHVASEQHLGLHFEMWLKGQLTRSFNNETKQWEPYQQKTKGVTVVFRELARSLALVKNTQKPTDSLEELFSVFAVNLHLRIAWSCHQVLPHLINITSVPQLLLIIESAYFYVQNMNLPRQDKDKIVRTYSDFHHFFNSALVKYHDIQWDSKTAHTKLSWAKGEEYPVNEYEVAKNTAQTKLRTYKDTGQVHTFNTPEFVEYYAQKNKKIEDFTQDLDQIFNTFNLLAQVLEENFSSDTAEVASRRRLAIRLSYVIVWMIFSGLVNESIRNSDETLMYPMIGVAVLAIVSLALRRNVLHTVRGLRTSKSIDLFDLIIKQNGFEFRKPNLEGELKGALDLLESRNSKLHNKNRNLIIYAEILLMFAMAFFAIESWNAALDYVQQPLSTEQFFKDSSVPLNGESEYSSGLDTTQVFYTGGAPPSFASTTICWPAVGEGPRSPCSPLEQLMNDVPVDRVTVLNTEDDLDEAITNWVNQGMYVQKKFDSRFHEIPDGTELVAVYLVDDDSTSVQWYPGTMVLFDENVEISAAVFNVLPQKQLVGAGRDLGLSSGYLTIFTDKDFSQYENFGLVNEAEQLVQQQLEKQYQAIKDLSVSEIQVAMQLSASERGWLTNQEIIVSLNDYWMKHGYEYGSKDDFNGAKTDTYAELVHKILKEDKWDCEMIMTINTHIIRDAQKHLADPRFTIYLRSGYVFPDSFQSGDMVGKLGHLTILFQEVDGSYQSFPWTLGGTVAQQDELSESGVIADIRQMVHSAQEKLPLNDESAKGALVLLLAYATYRNRSGLKKSATRLLPQLISGNSSKKGDQVVDSAKKGVSVAAASVIATAKTGEQTPEEILIDDGTFSLVEDTTPDEVLALEELRLAAVNEISEWVMQNDYPALMRIYESLRVVLEFQALQLPEFAELAQQVLSEGTVAAPEANPDEQARRYARELDNSLKMLCQPTYIERTYSSENIHYAKFQQMVRGVLLAMRRDPEQTPPYKIIQDITFDRLDADFLSAVKQRHHYIERGINIIVDELRARLSQVEAELAQWKHQRVLEPDTPEIQPLTFDEMTEFSAALTRVESWRTQLQSYEKHQRLLHVAITVFEFYLEKSKP